MYDTKLDLLFGNNYRIIKLFLNNQNTELNLAEAEKKLSISKMTIYRSLEYMVKIGILKSRSDNYRRFYKLIESPFIPILKTLRNVDSPVINKFLKKFKSKSHLILLYGSRANGTDRVDSDWDILIVSSKINIVELNQFISNLELEFDCQINVKLYSLADFEKIKAEKTPFYSEIMSNKIVLIGELDET
jgi:predicted nucleotidyltransferase